jgi:hypothetical protein
MSLGEPKALYKLAAHWASTSFDHMGVYEIFDGGTFFGKQVPALFLCFKGSVEPQGVFPHKRRIGVKEKVIAIYPFLYALKDRLSTPSIKEESTTETADRERVLEELNKLMELPEVVGYSDKLTIIEGEKCLTIYCVESGKYTPSSLPTRIGPYRIRCVKI